MAGFLRGLGAAFSGASKGAAKAAVLEDERRVDLSKTVYADMVTQSDTFLERKQKILDEIDEEKQLVASLEGMVVNGKPLTLVERQGLVRFALANNYDAPAKVLEDFEMNTEEGARIINTKGATKKVATRTPQEDDSTLLFGSRTKAATEDALKLLKATGRDIDVTMPSRTSVEGVRFKLKDTDNKYKDFDYGSFTMKNSKGELAVVQGILNPEISPSEGRLYLDPETNSYKPVPSDAEWNGKTPTRTISQNDSTFNEVARAYTADVLKIDSKLDVRSAEYREAVASGNVLMSSLQRLSEIALKDENYSSLMALFGSASRGVKNQLAGIKFVFAGNGVSEEEAYEADTLNIRNADGTLNVGRASDVLDELDKQMQTLQNETLSRAEDISSNRDLMEIMALRMAIAEIVVDGDARPSDFDVQSRMKGYLANGSEKFMKLANETIAKTQSTLANRRNALEDSPALVAARNDTTDSRLNELEQAAAQRFIDLYAPSLDSALELPEFTQQGFDTSQFVDPPERTDQPIIEFHTKEDGTKVKRVIMPDGGYLRDGGKILEAPETMPNEAIMNVASELLKKEQK